ncbi:hypothetical protein NHQ30_002403 [Ciborinia camelliae]|nr:hypothetical protein NHQ30_002403 [Ciborinia camelliae]
MEFETSEDKREELRGIVEWARTWKFRMGDRGVLCTRKRKSADVRTGEEEDIQHASLGDVKIWEWRGKQVHWSDICPFCIGDSCVGDAPAEGKDGDKCRERLDLIERGEGPMLVVMELQWRLRGFELGEADALLEEPSMHDDSDGLLEESSLDDSDDEGWL